MPELREEDMIHNGLEKNPFPAWLWLAVLAGIAALLWGGASWFSEKKQEVVADSPFLQVTNRNFSLFLWQNPEYMRANVSSKTGYLPGFQYEKKISIEPGKAEEFVSAPPEVIFLYHVWKRLVGNEFSKRIISVGEFRDFLAYCPEWLPENWPKAPLSYKETLKTLSKEDNASTLVGIPKDVQRAFIGWKNYFIEGSRINAVRPTYKQMTQFLNSFPNYARNFWKNIVAKGKPDYLKSLASEKFDPQAEIPENELVSFLKVAFYNYQQDAYAVEATNPSS